MSIDVFLDENVMTHTMQYYATVKKNETMKFTAKWIELEKLMLNDVTQTQKDKPHMVSLI